MRKNPEAAPGACHTEVPFEKLVDKLEKAGYEQLLIVQALPSSAFKMAMSPLQEVA